MARKGENIYKRKDGRWEGRYIIGRKSDGHARYASIYGRNYREVKEALERKKGEQYRAMPNCSLTVKALMAMWLSLRSTEIKASSYQHYLALIESQIVPRLGSIRLNNLTAEILSAFVKELMERGRLDGKGGLAASTVSGIMSILRSAIRLAGKKYAVRDISLFDVKGPTVRQKKVPTLSTAECETLARCIMAELDLSGAAYLLALGFGLRLGEICGLRWADIRFSEGVLTINHTVLRIRDGERTKLVVQTPKTESAHRMIPLTNRMLTMLVQLRNHASDKAFITAITRFPRGRSTPSITRGRRSCRRRPSGAAKLPTGWTAATTATTTSGPRGRNTPSSALPASTAPWPRPWTAAYFSQMASTRANSFM